MRIARYTGRSAREALSKVRDDMGQDAYILGNRMIDGNIELTAGQGLGDLPDTSAPEAPPSSEDRDLREPLGEIQFKVLEKEFRQLRDVIERELGARSWQEVSQQQPALSAVRQRLFRMGLPRPLVEHLLHRVSADAAVERAWRLALGALVRSLPTLNDPFGREAPDRIVALYGGTGVGKTSTIAKLAGRDVQRVGVEGVGLINFDVFRIGAQEQLACFAEAAGIPCLPVSDARSFAQALRKLRGRRIYIDTSGMSHTDKRLRDQFKLISGARIHTTHLLVLAASAQTEQNHAIAAAFGAGHFSGAIVTKLDEAHSLGGLMDTVINGRLALHSFAFGQRIPEDIRPANADFLVRRAVTLAKFEGSAKEQQKTATTQQPSKRAAAKAS
ncbi:MAG: flagellar biosynthesis protein FlhF [Pseudomonadota bacterium]